MDPVQSTLRIHLELASAWHPDGYQAFRIAKEEHLIVIRPGFQRFRQGNDNVLCSVEILNRAHAASNHLPFLIYRKNEFRTGELQILPHQCQACVPGLGNLNILYGQHLRIGILIDNRNQSYRQHFPDLRSFRHTVFVSPVRESDGRTYFRRWAPAR